MTRRLLWRWIASDISWQSIRVASATMTVILSGDDPPLEGSMLKPLH
jgi:hypothetical protein